jgi:hypothetical protein
LVKVGNCWFVRVETFWEKFGSKAVKTCSDRKSDSAERATMLSLILIGLNCFAKQLKSVYALFSTFQSYHSDGCVYIFPMIGI